MEITLVKPYVIHLKRLKFTLHYITLHYIGVVRLSWTVAFRFTIVLQCGGWVDTEVISCFQTNICNWTIEPYGCIKPVRVTSNSSQRPRWFAHKTTKMPSAYARCVAYVCWTRAPDVYFSNNFFHFRICTIKGMRETQCF